MSEIKPHINDVDSSEPWGLIGRSNAYYQMLQTIKQVASTQITVLITGESGTGKEMIAQALHTASERADKPMFTVNCGAIPEGILESELFGHEKGAFTGAHESRKGYFELAHHGTLFLDEIGEMPLSTQVKLLRVLEEREILRVGGTQKIKVNVRLIAATNRDLEQAIEKGEFRRDLYYRLNTVKIWIPPLRQRKEDIRPLISHFTGIICQDNKITFEGFSEDALKFFEEFTWPGNIRELRNMIERVIILEKGKLIDLPILESHFGTQSKPEPNLPVVVHKTPDQVERELIYRTLLDLRMAVDDIRSILLSQNRIPQPLPHMFDEHEEHHEDDVPQSMKEIEKEHILKILQQSGYNKRKAAKSLGIGERTLYRKLKEYNIHV